MLIGYDKPYGTECLSCDAPILVMRCADCGAPRWRQHRHVCNHCAYLFGMRVKDRTYTVREYA
jgi:hypothetical protein